MLAQIKPSIPCGDLLMPTIPGGMPYSNVRIILGLSVNRIHRRLSLSVFTIHNVHWSPRIWISRTRLDWLRDILESQPQHVLDTGLCKCNLQLPICEIPPVTMESRMLSELHSQQKHLPQQSGMPLPPSFPDYLPLSPVVEVRSISSEVPCIRRLSTDLRIMPILQDIRCVVLMGLMRISWWDNLAHPVPHTFRLSSELLETH